MKKISISKKNILLYMLTFIIVLIGDQLTKYMTNMTFQLGSSYTIIDNFFSFTYVHNTGAAWGMLAGNMNLFYIITIIAAIAIVYYFVKSQPQQKLTRFGLVLIFSGMIGNFIDRLMFGYVRDFIDFIIFGYDFPVFNIADMGVVIGVGCIILEIAIEEYQTWKLSKSV